MSNAEWLTIHMKRGARTAWNSLLQKGFSLHGHSGLTVRQFLTASLGYDDCIIDTEVRTIFLNSSPVDDIDAVYVKDGDRIALGSAMPGLVGICMGRDNPYKEFRSGIACQGGDSGDFDGESIRVFVKIFSTLAVDTGEAVLQRGIWVKAEHLAQLLEGQKDHLVSNGLPDLAANGDGEILVAVRFV